MPRIPNKLYFRIGEVSDIVGVKPYVLRYWESEFQDIRPSKSKSGQRLYKRRDVELLVRIKGLLYDERFTINGARKRLKDAVRAEPRDTAQDEVLPAEAAARERREPKQLDVFEESSVRRPAASKSAAGKEGSKAFIKIRRDLEDILKVIRA